MPPRVTSDADPLTAFSLDGRFLAVATPDGRLTTFDTSERSHASGACTEAYECRACLYDGHKALRSRDTQELVHALLTAPVTIAGTSEVSINLAADGRLVSGKHRVHDLAGQSFEQHTAVTWVRLNHGLAHACSPTFGGQCSAILCRSRIARKSYMDVWKQSVHFD